MSSAAISVDRVRRRFDRTVALDDISFEVVTGSALALLGPNGAGKSTLLRIASTLLRPNEGTVRILGFDAATEGMEVRRRIGLLSHESFLYGDLSVNENLNFYARLYGINDVAARIDTIATDLDLIGWRHRPVRTLSRGTTQRAALARVLLAAPEVLFLDEPFTGLDVRASDGLSDVLRRLHTNGTTLVMTTHDLGRAAEICNEALILVGGRKVWHGAVGNNQASTLIEEYTRYVA